MGGCRYSLYEVLKMPWESTPQDVLDWEGNCAQFGRNLINIAGGFCANLRERKGPLPLC